AAHVVCEQGRRVAVVVQRAGAVVILGMCFNQHHDRPVHEAETAVVVPPLLDPHSVDPYLLHAPTLLVAGPARIATPRPAFLVSTGDVAGVGPSSDHAAPVGTGRCLTPNGAWLE